MIPFNRGMFTARSVLIWSGDDEVDSYRRVTTATVLSEEGEATKFVYMIERRIRKSRQVTLGSSERKGSLFIGLRAGIWKGLDLKHILSTETQEDTSVQASERNLFWGAGVSACGVRPRMLRASGFSPGFYRAARGGAATTMA